MLATFYGGLGPGILVTLLSTLAIDYYFIAPYNDFEITLGNLIRAMVFMAVASLISWLNASRKKLMDNLREWSREREALVTQISGFNQELGVQVESARQELSEANQALFQMQQRLGRSERLAIAGQMAASLAHDIGTPLNAVSGHLQLLARDHAQHADTQRRLRIVNQQIVFIIGIVKRLLEWTHRKPAVGQQIDVNELLRELFWLVTPTLDQNKITVTFHLEPELPRLLADRDGFHQVFLNLINNSVEAMPEGGKIEIATHFDAQADTVVVCLSDTGEGIEPQALEYLFEPMWTTKPSGSGFGLAIAHEIISDHNGRISVRSIPGNGTTMTVTLPLVATNEPLHWQEEVAKNVS